MPMKFISALWDDPSLGQTEVVISFGTDCTTFAAGNPGTPCGDSSALHTRVGWDDVTGMGTPNAEAFADYFKPTSGSSVYESP
jgi:hypothetical protein